MSKYDLQLQLLQVGFFCCMVLANVIKFATIFAINALVGLQLWKIVNMILLIIYLLILIVLLIKMEFLYL